MLGEGAATLTAVAADVQALLDAVSSRVRREILWLTWDAELSVGDIGRHFEISGPTLSSHLATLRDAGLVTMRIDGNFRRYRCNQDAVRALVPFLAANDERWIAADDIDERERASASHGLVTLVAVEVPISPAEVFEEFTDGDRYSDWLGAPVQIRDRHFRATLEWGTEVRGTYEVVSPPDLIAMRWDFDDEAVPVPGRTPLVAYLRVHATLAGSRVEVHQLADDAQQAAFLTDAWSMVLGRFAEAHTGGGPATRSARPRRPKRRPT
jgi:DNA-binding transcriptional ArsR family regulator